MRRCNQGGLGKWLFRTPGVGGGGHVWTQLLPHGNTALVQQIINATIIHSQEA